MKTGVLCGLEFPNQNIYFGTFQWNRVKIKI
jgi:hypothetical protein